MHPDRRIPQALDTSPSRGQSSHHHLPPLVDCPRLLWSLLPWARITKALTAPAALSLRGFLFRSAIWRLATMRMTAQPGRPASKWTYGAKIVPLDIRWVNLLTSELALVSCINTTIFCTFGSPFTHPMNYFDVFGRYEFGAASFSASV